MRLLKMLLISLTLLVCMVSQASDAPVRKIVILNRVFTSAGAYGQYENEYGGDRDLIPEDGLMCVIDMTEGVYLCGNGCEDNFDSYEIWDTPNTCMAVYYDEPSFVKAALTIQSTCKIRINTSSTCYEGILKK